MPETLRSTVVALTTNSVRISVEVPRGLFQGAVESYAKSLTIPGHRGRVTMPVALRYVGRRNLIAQVIEDHIGNWFWAAAATHRLRPASDPVYDAVFPHGYLRPWSFAATFTHEPAVEPADWRSLTLPDESDPVLLRAEVSDAIAAKAGVDVPARLVQARARDLIATLTWKVNTTVAPLDAALALSRVSPDDLAGRLFEQARCALAREIALEAIADDLGVTVTDDEIEERVRLYARPEYADGSVAHVFRTDGRHLLRDQIRIAKTLDYVIEELSA